MFNLSKQNFSIIPLFLLLISCKLSAYQEINQNEFNASLQKVESLIDNDPKKALLVLTSYHKDISAQPLISQVNFYRIQAKAYSDQALYKLSKESANIALRLTQQLNSPSILVAELSFTKGFSLESLGDFDGAFELYQNGLDVARSMNHQEFIAKGLINIGAIYYLRKNYKQSLISLNQALQIANNIKDEALLGFITSELGILYAYLNKNEKVSEFFQQSYQHYKKAGKYHYALNNLYNVALTHANQENYDEAIKTYRELEGELRDNTRSAFVTSLYRSLASAFISKENADVENAYRYIQLAGVYIKDVEEYVIQLQYCLTKAKILEKMGRYQEALANIEQVEAIFESNVIGTYELSKLRMLNLKAKLYYNLGQYEQAYNIQEKYFTQSISNRESHDSAEIDELRLQYEIETSERQQDILKQKQSIQNIQLDQFTEEGNHRKLFSLMLVICIIVLLFMLYKVLNGQKHVNNIKYTDNLTGILNRRRILQIGYQYFKEAQNTNQHLSICLINIDCFKEINNELGHNVGDKILQKIADHGQIQMRENDAWGRFASKQFIALLPFTDHAEAFEVAKRIKEDIETVKWHEEEITPLNLNVAVSTFNNSNYDNFNSLVKAANEQLLNLNKPIEIRSVKV